MTSRFLLPVLALGVAFGQGPERPQPRPQPVPPQQQPRGPAGLDGELNGLRTYLNLSDAQVMQIRVAGERARKDAEDKARANESVRAFDYLQAAIFFGGLIDRDHDAGQIGGQVADVVPVSVVLVPLPRAADLRILHDHLRVVVPDRSAENLLHGADDSRTAGKHAVQVVSRIAP